MKTTPAPAVPQSSGHPLRIVESNSENSNAIIAPLKKEEKAPAAKEISITDKPEAWDESWFANYE